MPVAKFQKSMRHRCKAGEGNKDRLDGVLLTSKTRPREAPPGEVGTDS